MTCVLFYSREVFGSPLLLAKHGNGLLDASVTSEETNNSAWLITWNAQCQKSHIICTNGMNNSDVWTGWQRLSSWGGNLFTKSPNLLALPWRRLPTIHLLWNKPNYLDGNNYYQEEDDDQDGVKLYHIILLLESLCTFIGSVTGLLVPMYLHFCCNNIVW